GIDLPDDRPLLGVMLEKVEGGVEVRRILRGTAAERHGIRPGDVLTAIDAQPVTTSEEVIEAIKSHDRGNKLKVTLTRRGVELELEVSL
ncbi:MAG: PDZ domain-containing protein, partial [Planctomycetota bacterium]